MATTKHAVVRTDNMAGTDVRSLLVSVKYMGTGKSTPTEIDNGHVLKVGDLVKGEREIHLGEDVTSKDSLDEVVLLASPEIMYDERLKNLDDYVNVAGKAIRGYHFHPGDIFSVTKEAFDGTPDVGQIVELADGTKLKTAASATPESTQVGVIIEKETVGRYEYFAVLVGATKASD